MENLEDLLKAKQDLSNRLLRDRSTGIVFSAISTLSARRDVNSTEKNVHAVGIGPKIVSGATTKDTCIRIYVVKKERSSRLSNEEMLPKQIDGISTDVIESPRAYISQIPCTTNRMRRQRPVMAGISAAHFADTAGTISCFCHSTRSEDGPSKVFVMSNSHVFARVNEAQIGDALYQPGPADGGTVDDYFAKLFRFVRIQMDANTPNRVDAAIGEVLNTMQHDPQICQIGRITGTQKAIENSIAQLSDFVI